MLLLLMGREEDAKESFSLYAPELKKTHPELGFDDLLEIYNAQFRIE